MAKGITRESIASIRVGKDPVDVVTARLAPDAGAIHDALQSLSEQERERASKYRQDRARINFVVARARLRELIAERLAIRPEEVELDCSRYGKPSLPPGFTGTDLRFNVSHSRDVVAFAFSIGREIGIDIEAIRDFPGIDTVATHSFSRRERQSYLCLEPDERPLGFFNCWTRKEAFVKALGAGLSYSLDRFDVSLEPDRPAQLLRVDDLPGDRCGWQLASCLPIGGFAAAIVAEDETNRGGRRTVPQPYMDPSGQFP